MGENYWRQLSIGVFWDADRLDLQRVGISHNRTVYTHDTPVKVKLSGLQVLGRSRLGFEAVDGPHSSFYHLSESLISIRLFSERASCVLPLAIGWYSPKPFAAMRFAGN